MGQPGQVKSAVLAFLPGPCCLVARLPASGCTLQPSSIATLALPSSSPALSRSQPLGLISP